MDNYESLLGKYNAVSDFFIHIILSFGVSIWLIFFQLPFIYFIVCFLVGLLLDADHFLNRSAAKLLRIRTHESSLMYGSGGCVIKIGHGFDISFLFGMLCLAITHNYIFALLVFKNLCLHEFYDFITYPHSWKELFLFTRIKYGFYPGQRKKFIGRVFDYATLKF